MNIQTAIRNRRRWRDHFPEYVLSQPEQINSILRLWVSSTPHFCPFPDDCQQNPQETSSNKKISFTICRPYHSSILTVTLNCKIPKSYFSMKTKLKHMQKLHPFWETLLRLFPNNYTESFIHWWLLEWNRRIIKNKKNTDKWTICLFFFFSSQWLFWDFWGQFSEVIEKQSQIIADDHR